MYSKLPNLVIGFHGCDISVYNKILYEHDTLKHSNNSYDWLGNGIYFWEHNRQRAYEWALNNSKRKDTNIHTPAVLGAVIDLGRCLNLTDSGSIDEVKIGYEMLFAYCQKLNKELPINRDVDGNKDLLLRDLDCAVIQQIHDYNTNEINKRYDSVRGVFIEGDEIYPNSGFKEKTHIQICVVNPNCIKGYFSPLSVNEDYNMP